MGGTAEHLKGHRFQKGNRLGGRPVGSRNRLSEVMLQLLAADAQANGAAVIARVREEDPSTWLRCMCSLMPRQLMVEKASQLGHLDDDELAMLEEHLAAARAKLVKQIEKLDAPVLDAEPVAVEPLIAEPKA
jgi:hypothetical protein